MANRRSEERISKHIIGSLFNRAAAGLLVAGSVVLGTAAAVMALVPTDAAAPQPTETATPTLTATDTPPPTPTSSPCETFPPPTLTFELSTDPANPVIGDEVQLSFTVSGRGGLPAYTLTGAAPVFQGDTSTVTSNQLGTVTYHLTAVQVGTATLTLKVNYETAVGCVNQPIFEFVSDTSPPFNVEVAASTLPPHDSVVLPPKPLTVHLRSATPVAKTVKVTVVNADIVPTPETPGHTITLIASDGDCPAGTVSGTPHFITRAGDLGDSILLAGGKSATAKVPLHISASAFTGFNHITPTRCTLQFSVTSAGNSDPAPLNNTVPMELNVIDQTDAEQTAVHENFIKSLVPLRVSIMHGRSRATKKRHPTAGNTDILPTAEDPGDLLTVTGRDGSCPVGTLGVVDMDTRMPGIQNPVIVKGGRTKTGTLPVTATSTSFTTTNKKSPTRCIATVTVAGPGGDTDGTDNTSKLVIDVYDKNDF